MFDTICAISTALGIGAISIVRVSGKDAIKTVKKIFKGPDLTKKETHTITYGHIVSKKKIIDEVLVTIMKAPKTFTTEDIVEINCHGGISTTNKVLELLLLNGCRLAEPGEFTKRAFLNGRIDLIEAEGVMEVINSKTEKSRDLAISQLSGSVSNKIQNLRNNIVKVIANIEVNIDYPEYDDIRVMTTNDLEVEIKNLEKELNKILEDSESGKIIEEGIKTAIIGRPNVGKSSILNRLLEEDKAIVTDIAGTTRDIVEGKININGLILNILDTAGIRQTKDKVEKIGVDKSFNLIDEANLILFVLNNNEELTDLDKEILEKLKDKNYIIIINKEDLKPNLDKSKLDKSKTVTISALNNKGIEELKTKIKDIYNISKIEVEDLTYLANARSVALIKESLNLIPNIKKAIKNNTPIDIIEIDLKTIWNNLGLIIGETYEEELINQLFSQFCLGK